MNLIADFLDCTQFTSYEQLCRDFKLHIKDDFNFGLDVVDKYAACEPNKTALIWCNDSGEEKFITFADVARESNRIANMFYDKGIRRGDFVLLMLMSRFEYWYATVACHKLGAIVIPATSQLTYKDIVYRCNYAGIKAIVSVNTPTLTEYILKARPDCKALEHIFAVNGGAEGFEDFEALYKTYDGGKLNFTPMRDKNAPMLAYFTSGTTGLPKMALHSYTYPVAHIATAMWHGCTDKSLQFTAADTGWAKASWGKIYGQWICGAALFTYDYYGKYTPLDLLPLLQKYKVTGFCAPPTVYRFLIQEDLSRFDLSSIEHYCTAGEPLNPVVYEQIKQKIGKSIYEGYGQTETVVAIGTFPYMEPHPGSMGKPCPVYEIALLDDHGNPVPDDTEGEICIKLKPEQAGLFVEYYNNEKQMQAARYGGYYHTGDVAIRDKDGYYWFVSRDDDIIKSSGYRIGPFEVESALLEHPAVSECAITAVPDEIRGQVVKATVVLARGYTPSDALKKELQNHVKHITAPYKYPRIVEFVTSLPKTISEKIRRVEIRENDKNKK
ncbi:MAG: AMP-binding protein [Clostridiales bacterium]|nr:AMP-binding protein [Clostridiales bacterium]